MTKFFDEKSFEVEVDNCLTKKRNLDIFSTEITKQIIQKNLDFQNKKKNPKDEYIINLPQISKDIEIKDQELYSKRLNINDEILVFETGEVKESKIFDTSIWETSTQTISVLELPSEKKENDNWSEFPDEPSVDLSLTEFGFNALQTLH